MRTVITDNGPRPQLKYFDGATCPEDKTQELATQIDFRCDPRAGKVSGFHSFLLGDHRIHIFMFFFFFVRLDFSLFKGHAHTYRLFGELYAFGRLGDKCHM